MHMHIVDIYLSIYLINKIMLFKMIYFNVIIYIISIIIFSNMRYDYSLNN